MRDPHPMRCAGRQGVTLIETLVVILIIALMVSLLMPALQHARHAASRTACQNNLRQVALAARQYYDTYKKLPDPAPVNELGGWPVELLVFLEQKALKDALLKDTNLNPVSISEAAQARPKILSCPVGSTEPSTIAVIPIAHYVLAVNKDRDTWLLGDMPPSLRTPWVVSPEMTLDGWNNQFGPHEGGFHIARPDGSVDFRMGVTE